jgi:hypothetical protein
MADIFNVETYSDAGVGSTSSSFANPRYGPDLDTGDLRRKFNFGDRVSELAIAQDPFFRLVSKVSKKPTDDPRFKYTEKRGSWHKRYAYVVDHGTTSALGNASNSEWASGASDAGDEYYFKMGTDYLSSGNRGNVFGQANNDVSVGDTGTQPVFFLEDQLIKIPTHTQGEAPGAGGADPDDYAICKVKSVSTTGEYILLKTEVIKPPFVSGSAAAVEIGSYDTNTPKGTGVADYGDSQVDLEKQRCYVVGSSYGEGTGYPETWKDQPYLTGYGQTQIWKTSMAMSNSARATVLRYEPNEWQRIWKEKLIEHKWDIEQSLLFGSQYTDGDGVSHTQGIVDFVVNNGNVFSWSTAKTVDSFLDDMSNYMDPRYNSSSATVYMCSTDVYNWFHKLGGYAKQNMNIGLVQNAAGSENQGGSVYTSDLAVAGRKKVLGLDTTTINTVHGDMNLIRNIHLDGTQVKILGVNMNYAKYRPLVGMELNMPECHAVWK